MKLYFQFTERNEWEGETFHFYIPLNSEELEVIREAIENLPAYELSLSALPEEEVDRMLQLSDDNGYMSLHNKCERVDLELIKNTNLDEGDPFYKGQCWVGRIGGAGADQ